MPALPGGQVEQLAGGADLGAWLRAEHLVLLRAIAQAAAVGSASPCLADPLAPVADSRAGRSLGGLGSGRRDRR